MSIVVHVGNQTDLPPIPDGFPTCGVSTCKTCDQRGTTPKICEPNKAVMHQNIFIVFIVTLLAYILF